MIIAGLESIDEAVELLKRGELVAFPTETVYGLGADAGNPESIKKLYAAKGRPSNHPVIVHLAHADQLSQWASRVPDAAIKLAEKFWPGPLTMILPKADHVRGEITGGQSSVGLRIPSHPLALSLLRSFGGGVIAPSANKFGRLSPTRAEDVRTEFQNEVALVLDGGPCTVGIESTIIDLSKDAPMILRPGMIDSTDLEAVIGPVSLSHQAAAQQELTRVPGDLPSHYAPSTPLRLVTAEELKVLVASHDALRNKAVLSFVAAPAGANWVVAADDPHSFARDLYFNLRQLDKLNLTEIVVETPPQGAIWSGVRDRLNRAASK